MADPTRLSSEPVGTGSAEVDCSLEIERKYDIIPAVICSMCCLFGIIYCFFGEKQTLQPPPNYTHARGGNGPVSPQHLIEGSRHNSHPLGFKHYLRVHTPSDILPLIFFKGPKVMGQINNHKSSFHVVCITRIDREPVRLIFVILTLKKKKEIWQTIGDQFKSVLTLGQLLIYMFTAL